MLRIGILGGATIVPRFVKGVNLSGVAQVIALARRDVTQAKQMAEALGIPQVYPTYQALLQAPDIDLVYLPLINSQHFPVAKMALEAGKSVLLEKPFTLTTEQAQTLFELARAKHCFLMEAQKAVFLPVILEVKKQLEAGIIGDLEHIDIQESRAGVESIPWFHDLRRAAAR